MSARRRPQGADPAAYDAIADAYRRARGLSVPPVLKSFRKQFARGAHLLDAGCGNGVPVARYLLRNRLRVTGIDGSRAQIALARTLCPQGSFRCADMTTVELRANSFDGIVAWDSIFHVPRAGHAALFRRFARWLRPGGSLLLTLGGSSWQGRAPMLGATLFFSGYTPRKSLELLGDAGFAIEHQEIDDPSSRGHMVVVAGLTK